MHKKRANSWSALSSVALLLLAAVPAHGADLLSIFDQALINDPQIREAEAIRLAQREARPQALAALLPQISGSVTRSRSWNNGDSFSSTFIGEVETPQDPPPSKGRSTTKSWGINLRQNVFNWGNWVALRTANKEVAQAEADYLAQRQALAQRVAQQYFAVLQAQDTVRALEAARDAISRQLEQAERRFEVGLIAITDVQESRAERDNSAAQVIAAKRALASAEEQLRATIGEKPAVLKEPPEDMPLRAPDPATAEDWVRLSMEQNATLISSRLAADIARNQVDAAFSGHLPSLDLSAGRNHNNNNGSTTYFPDDDDTFSSRNSSTSNGKSVSLVLSIPLFSGGATSSRKRQSEYLWIAAKERLERTSRTTERNARDAFLGVSTEAARVQALKQAVESSRTALTATETGNEVGTRTAIDVLDRRRALVQAQTNFSAAKYDYLNSLIQLHLAAGDLDRDTIAEINNLLTVTPAQ
jgi:outer membrane protein